MSTVAKIVSICRDRPRRVEIIGWFAATAGLGLLSCYFGYLAYIAPEPKATLLLLMLLGCVVGTVGCLLTAIFSIVGWALSYVQP